MAMYTLANGDAAWALVDDKPSIAHLDRAALTSRVWHCVELFHDLATNTGTLSVDNNLHVMSFDYGLSILPHTVSKTSISARCSVARAPAASSSTTLRLQRSGSTTARELRLRRTALVTRQEVPISFTIGSSGAH